MKTILITGATDGIGLETAKLLAAEGHHLLLHGRNKQKLLTALQQLKEINPGADLEEYLADLSDFEQVKQLVQDIKRGHDSLDIIINNAGILKSASPVTKSGIDVRFVVNTISPYLLTQGLLSILSDEGRVVNLSSAAQAPVNLDALTGKIQIKDDFQAYAQSKLAITIWSQELAKQLSKQQIITAVNPGSLLASKMVKEGFGLAGNDLAIGADILLRAALSDEFVGQSGQYFDNDVKRFSLPHNDAIEQQVCSEIMEKLTVLHQLHG